MDKPLWFALTPSAGQEAASIAWQLLLCLAVLRTFMKRFILWKSRLRSQPPHLAFVLGFCARLLLAEGRAAQMRPGSAHREARSWRDSSAPLSTRSNSHAHTRGHNSNLSAKVALQCSLSVFLSLRCSLSPPVSCSMPQNLQRFPRPNPSDADRSLWRTLSQLIAEGASGTTAREFHARLPSGDMSFNDVAILLSILTVEGYVRRLPLEGVFPTWDAPILPETRFVRDAGMLGINAANVMRAPTHGGVPVVRLETPPLVEAPPAGTVLPPIWPGRSDNVRKVRALYIPVVGTAVEVRLHDYKCIQRWVCPDDLACQIPLRGNLYLYGDESGLQKQLPENANLRLFARSMGENFVGPMILCARHAMRDRYENLPVSITRGQFRALSSALGSGAGGARSLVEAGGDRWRYEELDGGGWTWVEADGGRRRCRGGDRERRDVAGVCRNVPRKL